MLIPLLLLAALVAVVALAHSKRKKGTLSEAAYSKLVSGVSIVVTIAALAVLYLGLQR
jgi:Na+/H+ antiporter NhaD/arsenite permease-like protein